MENKVVLETLRETESLLEGHFLLTSGKHSDRYCQCAQLFQYPSKAKKITSYITDQVEDLGATVVLGPAMGGIIAGYELARQLGLKSIFCERNDKGEMTLRRNFTLSPEDKVIIAEDVVTTAKSALETAALIESYGAQVVALTCIVDRRVPGASTPFPIYSATTLEVGAYEADDCPLCSDDVELVQPGSRKMK